MMDFRDALLFLSTAGAALAAYWAMDECFILDRLTPKEKRWAAIGLTALIALAAWGVQIAMLYAPQPAAWRDWIEQGFAVAGAAVGLNQLIHSRDLTPRAVDTPTRYV